jgi:hypothetical protein
LDRLTGSHLRNRAHAAAGLIVTSHLPGLLPTLHECRTTPELLAAIVGELGGEEAALAAPGLFGRHRGNLRDALRELYDEAAGITSPSAARRGSPSP